MMWLETRVRALADGDHYVWSPWVLAEDDWGDLRVPSIRGRIKHGEPWWAKHFRPSNPLHLVYALWTLRKRGVGMIESA